MVLHKGIVAHFCAAHPMLAFGLGVKLLLTTGVLYCLWKRREA